MDILDTDTLRDLINKMKTCDSTHSDYILFFPREPQGYVKEFIEKNNLQYKIIGLPEQCGIDMDVVYVVPENLYKPIKLVYQNDKILGGSYE